MALQMPAHRWITSLTLAGFSICLTLHAHSAVFKPEQDCLNSVLQMIAKKEVPLTDKTKLESAARYNDEIFKKTADLSEADRAIAIDDTIDHFASYDHSLDGKRFKNWLNENPGKQTKDETIGSYLNNRYQKYKETVPEKNLPEIGKSLPDDLKKIAKDCAGNDACTEKKIGGYLTRKLNGTCLAKNKSAAVRSMVTGLTLASAGYFASYMNHPEKGYPYDMMANTMFWTPILSEMGCRNTLAGGEIGKKVDFGQFTRKQKIKIGVNNYVDYLKVAPLTNMTYATFHTIRQISSGEKEWKDVDLVDLSKQVASLTLLDASVLMPRSILVTDPLFMKAFPKLRNFYYRKIPNKIGAEGTYLASDFGTRIGINFASTELINLWIEKSDQYWNTKFATDGKTPETEPQSKNEKKQHQ